MSKTETLRRQVGQLLILGFDGLEIDGKLRTTLSTLQPGGVILFARNVDEPRQTWRLLRDSWRPGRWALTPILLRCSIWDSRRRVPY
jgi:beta-glucosidase-like glycosyl hydrolase